MCETKIQRLYMGWVYGGFLFSFILIAFTPLLLGTYSILQILLYLHLPIYMIHQYEEHDDNRFKAFVDEIFGYDSLDQRVIFIINVLGVWCLFSALILLSSFLHVGFGLGIAYLTIINAVSHVGAGIKLKAYNPGLITSLVLFIPLSGITLFLASRAPEIIWYHHVAGIFVGIFVHVLIIMRVLSHRKGTA